MCDTKQARVIKRSVSQTDIASEAKANAIRRILLPNTVINLDHGDPTLFEFYWRKMGDNCTVVIVGDQSLSYFDDVKNICWFLVPKLEEEIRRLHYVVRNAVVDDHYIVVGTGSSQLIQAALYTLSNPDEPEPMSVVSAAPYYSSYPVLSDFLRSVLYKWAGDAHKFIKNGPYIEFVNLPNNPDGSIREPVVNGAHGRIIHDLAYYWPQYTAITSPLNQDVMLFTFSKCTGHAGSRIGWALVRDKEVAIKMTKFVEINTIGVSKEAQLRAAKILGVISDGCLQFGTPDSDNFFEYGRHLMAERWQRLRDVIKSSDMFSLPNYPLQYCHFTGQVTEAYPAFAWIKCEDNVEDCEEFFRGKKIITRTGTRFGSDPKYVRVGMLNREEEFDLFLERLSTIQTNDNEN